MKVELSWAENLFYLLSRSENNERPTVPEEHVCWRRRQLCAGSLSDPSTQWCGPGSLIGFVKNMNPKISNFKNFFLIHISMLHKWIIMLSMKFLFTCAKQKYNFYFKEHDILVIFGDFYASFTWFWNTWILEMLTRTPLPLLTIP